MNMLNKILNIMIFFIISLIVIFLIFNIIEPFFYSNNTVGSDIKDYECYSELKQVLDTYIINYRDQNFDKLKKATNFSKRLSDEEYQSIYEKYIKDQEKTVVIHSIKRCFNNVYVVNYSLNMNRENEVFEEPKLHKIIIKLFRIKDAYEIYYDGMSSEI